MGLWVVLGALLAAFVVAVEEECVLEEEGTKGTP